MKTADSLSFNQRDQYCNQKSATVYVFFSISVVNKEID